MIDKYSRLEEKVGEGLRRVGVMEGVFESVLGISKEEKKGMFSWENVAVKTGMGGLRLNVVEVEAKSSAVRFVLNQKKSELEKRFGEEFLDNAGKRETLSLRIR